MYRDIVDIILKDSHRNITHQESEVLTTQKKTDCEIAYDKLCFEDFIK